MTGTLWPHVQVKPVKGSLWISLYMWQCMIEFLMKKPYDLVQIWSKPFYFLELSKTDKQNDVLLLWLTNCYWYAFWTTSFLFLKKKYLVDHEACEFEEKYQWTYEYLYISIKYCVRSFPKGLNAVCSDSDLIISESINYKHRSLTFLRKSTVLKQMISTTTRDTMFNIECY